jgi:Zn-finger protein
MKTDRKVWKCKDCNAPYTEEDNQSVGQHGVTMGTFEALTQYIDKHSIETGHKEFDLIQGLTQ